MTKKHIVLALLLFTCGCSPTIGNNLDLGASNLELGVTRKSAVANTLGLPNSIKRDSTENLEYWFYNEKAELAGLILPLVTGAGTSAVSAIPIDVPIMASDKAKSAAPYMCV